MINSIFNATEFLCFRQNLFSFFFFYIHLFTKKDSFLVTWQVWWEKKNFILLSIFSAWLDLWNSNKWSIYSTPQNFFVLVKLYFHSSFSIFTFSQKRIVSLWRGKFGILFSLFSAIASSSVDSIYNLFLVKFLKAIQRLKN
jgi:hypothetical protein